MENLSFVNQKSNYSFCSQKAKEAEAITDVAEKLYLQLGFIKEANKIYIANLKLRQMDQVDKLNNIKTSFRNPEIKNFDQISIEEKIEHKEIEEGKKE